MEKPVIKHRYEKMDVKEIVSYSIVYKDVFSLGDFLSLLHHWLVQNEYASSDDSTFGESFYLQRESPRTGKQIQIRWRVNREQDKTSMYRFDIDIDMDVRGLQQVEFMHQGKKSTADKGEIEIKVSGKLITDYNKVWSEHSIFSKYKKFIFKSWLKGKGDAAIGELSGDGEKLQDFIKEHLRIQHYSPGQLQEFWPKKPPQ
jgi:hypothetical protein